MVELQSINVKSRSYKEQLIDIDLQAIAEAADNIAPSPSSYKVYTALLTQSGTDAPVVTVLENTLGEILVWSYSSNGTYRTTINDSLINNTYLSITNNMYDVDLVLQILSPGDGIIEIATFDNGALTDGVLSDTPIEIRVYQPLRRPIYSLDENVSIKG